MIVERRKSLRPVSARARSKSGGAEPSPVGPISPEFVQRRSSLLHVATRGASVTPSRRGGEPDRAFAVNPEPPPEFVQRRASLRKVSPP